LAQFLVNAVEGARILEKTKASKAATEAVVALVIGVLEPPGLAPAPRRVKSRKPKPQ
jgi:hypothetical protein